MSKPTFYCWLVDHCNQNRSNPLAPVCAALSVDLVLREHTWIIDASVQRLRVHLATDMLKLRQLFEDAVDKYEAVT